MLLIENKLSWQNARQGRTDSNVPAGELTSRRSTLLDSGCFPPQILGNDRGGHCLRGKETCGLAHLTAVLAESIADVTESPVKRQISVLGIYFGGRDS
jgi:hypothetical protein